MQIPEGAAWIGAQMETLFYFCLRKTSSADEAAELSQDIALAALDALRNSGLALAGGLAMAESLVFELIGRVS